MWRLAIPGTLIQSFVSTSVLALILKMTGWDWISGIILGMAISVASMVVMAFVLAEWQDLHAKIGHIAIGMLFDPQSLIDVPHVIGILLFVVMVVKPLTAALTLRMLGQPLATAIPVGAAFPQVGEFSFILGTVALGLGLINNAGQRSP